MKLRLLFKRYYLPDKSIRPRLLISIGFGAAILLILIVFSPFGMQNIKTFIERFIVAFGYSIIAFICWFALLLGTRKIQPLKIKLWKLLIFIFLFQIVIGTINTIFNNLIFRNPTFFEFFFDFQKIVHLTGILPTIILIIFLETPYYESISLKQKTLNTYLFDKESTSKMIKIEGGKPNQSTTFSFFDIISISSMDNYLRIETHKNNEIQKPQIIRGTLKYIEENYADIELLYKCHRSHIVNLIWIKEITGNSLNRKLKTKIGDITIPVSRTKVEEIIKKLENIE